MDSGAPSGVTFVDLEFDTGTRGGALLGDIASSLVSLDELLRDLASIAAGASSAEFRKIEIAAIEMRSPLRIRLSLFSISPEAVQAFERLCRYIIVSRDDRSRGLDSVKSAVELCTPAGVEVTEEELQRLHGHVVTLQDAEIPLKRVVVRGNEQPGA